MSYVFLLTHLDNSAIKMISANPVIVYVYKEVDEKNSTIKLLFWVIKEVIFVRFWFKTEIYDKILSTGKFT